MHRQGSSDANTEAQGSAETRRARSRSPVTLAAALRIGAPRRRGARAVAMATASSRSLAASTSMTSANASAISASPKSARRRAQASIVSSRAKRLAERSRPRRAKTSGDAAANLLDIGRAIPRCTAVANFVRPRLWVSRARAGFRSARSSEHAPRGAARPSPHRDPSRHDGARAAGGQWRPASSAVAGMEPVEQSGDDRDRRGHCFLSHAASARR